MLATGKVTHFPDVSVSSALTATQVDPVQHPRVRPDFPVTEKTQIK